MNDNLVSPDLPERRRPAHHVPLDRHNRSTILFLTVCTKDRRPLLANAAMHDILCTTWTAAGHWLVGRYVIMPDHLHLFCAPAAIEVKPLSNWVRFWKAAACRASAAPEGTLWQTDFWDTQLRQGDSYAAKWEYMRNNPVRHGLVSRTQDWPYQGELNQLRWHE